MYWNSFFCNLQTSAPSGSEDENDKEPLWQQNGRNDGRDLGDWLLLLLIICVIDWVSVGGGGAVCSVCGIWMLWPSRLDSVIWIVFNFYLPYLFILTGSVSKCQEDVPLPWVRCFLNHLSCVYIPATLVCVLIPRFDFRRIPGLWGLSVHTSCIKGQRPIAFSKMHSHDKRTLFK